MNPYTDAQNKAAAELEALFKAICTPPVDETEIETADEFLLGYLAGIHSLSGHLLEELDG